MEFPNFKNYVLATHLIRIIDWTCHVDNKDWVLLENNLGPIPLSHSPWIPWDHCSKQLKQHHLIGATLKNLQTITWLPSLTTSPGPLTPLTANPDFIPGMNSSIQLHCNRNSPLLAEHCFAGNKIKPLSELQTEMGLSSLNHWEYRQIHDYVMSPY